MNELKLALATFALGACIGLGFGLNINDGGWKIDAVKHRAAHYDTYTGTWMWNEPESRP